MIESVKQERVALYIDPPSHHYFRDRLFEVDPVNLTGDRANTPFAYLHEQLASRDVAVHTADLLGAEEQRGVRNVYIGFGYLRDFAKLARRSDTTLSAFFAMECPIVQPELYQTLYRDQRHFKRIYSWSDSASLERFAGGALRCLPFRWPQAFSGVEEPVWNQGQRRFLVMINANKLPAVYWQELYTERMRAVQFFGRHDEIDLYGVGWDVPSYRVGKSWVPNPVRRLQRKLLQSWQRYFPDPLLEAARRVYRGTTGSKIATLGKYTFALCFENMIIKGWITEKIFDCLYAGTVPIYWGATDIEGALPPECFIDMRRFSGYEELRSYLKGLGSKEIDGFREAGRDFLASPQFRPFSKEAFVERICWIVEEDTGVDLGRGVPSEAGAR